MRHSLNITLLIWWIGLLLQVRSTNLYYRLVRNCIQPTQLSCTKWNSTVDIFYQQGISFYMCFPQFTRVLTNSGPKYLNTVKVGDRILAYSQQAHPIYTEVTAWLHRDTDARTIFTQIKTRQGHTYISSGGHNIAYVNEEGQVLYKQADYFREGDELVSTGETLTVQTTSKIEAYGLYSPMTEAGNFYIFNDEQQGVTDKMILVHCLSDVENAEKNGHWVKKMIGVGGAVGLNRHTNKQHQQYIHPMTRLFFLLGKTHSVTYRVEGDGENREFGSRNGQKRQHEASSSGSSQRQRKKKQVVSLYGCLMQVSEVILQ